MAIYVDKNTRLIVQGITGQAGAFHTKACKEYGTQDRRHIFIVPISWRVASGC